MKITIEFKDIEEYLEFKEKTAQKEQLININTKLKEVDLKQIPYLSEQILLHLRNAL